MKLNDTSRKIMEVALELFSEKGYYSTTTKQIAQEAGVNELTIFRHFGSKSNLFQMVTEQVVVASQAEEILHSTGHLNFENAMPLITQRIYELYLANKKLYKVQMKLADDETDFVRLLLSRKFIEILEVYFAKLKAEGTVLGEPKLMARTLINSLLGTITVEVLGDASMQEFSWEVLVKEQTRQFICVYQAPAS